jgi:hypothetical protein
MGGCFRWGKAVEANVMRWLRFCLGVAGLTLVLVSCGQTQEAPQPSAQELVPSAQEPVPPEGWVAMPDGSFCGPLEPVPLSHNWMDLPSGRVLVSSVQDAATHLAFAPREPQGLGVPQWISVSNDLDARGIRTFWARYDAEPYGNIHINMWIDPVPLATRVASWQEDAAKALAGDPCFHGTAEMVTIRGGVAATIGAPPDENRVSIGWREGSILTMVSGPALQHDDAIAIAEKL